MVEVVQAEKWLIECICTTKNKKDSLEKLYKTYLLKNETPFTMFKRVDENWVSLEFLLKYYKIQYAHLKAVPIRHLINNSIDLYKNDLRYWTGMPGIGWKISVNYLNLIHPESPRIYLDDKKLKFLKDKGYEVPKHITGSLDCYLKYEEIYRNETKKSS